MPKVNPLHFVLGMHGLAVLRAWSRGGGQADDAVKRLVAFGASMNSEHARDLKESDVRSGYAEWSTTYDAPGNPLIDLEEPLVHSIIDKLPKGRALDAACGTGRHAKFLVERGFEVTGIDGCAEMLAIARAKVPEASLRLGDLTRLDFADANFDVVVCALALDHCDELSRAISELARVTRRGGTIVISTLHPLGLLMGGGAFYHSADGAYGIVYGPQQSVSDYVRAFRTAGLEIRDCFEPAWGDREINMLGSAALAPEAFRAAMAGMPCAMIWRLARP